MILADILLAPLAIAPSIIGVGLALLTYGSNENSWMIALCVGVSSLPSSIWIVRAHPRVRDRSPWTVLAFTGTATFVLALLTLFEPVRSVASAAAIGCLVATLAQVPLILVSRKVFHRPWIPSNVTPASPRHQQSVLARYKHLSPTVRFWVRGKMRWDPLFKTLHRHVPETGTLLDVGCGYALPAVWLACLHPHLKIIAFDSHPGRLRIARYVLDRRARVFHANARDWVAVFDAHDESLNKLDVVLCIDVVHHLDEPRLLLRDLAERMREDATLLLRTTVRGSGERHAHHIERWMVRMRGQRTVRFYERRDVETLLADCGFRLDCVERDKARTETLFVARRC